ARSPQTPVDQRLKPGRHRPRPPIRPIQQPATRPEPAFCTELVALLVQLSVLALQGTEHLPIPLAIGALLRARMAPVVEGHGVDLEPPPPVSNPVDPELPILELLEGRIEAPGRLDDLPTHQRREADRVAVQERVRIVRRKATLSFPVTTAIQVA